MVFLPEQEARIKELAVGEYSRLTAQATPTPGTVTIGALSRSDGEDKRYWESAVSLGPDGAAAELVDLDIEVEDLATRRTWHLKGGFVRPQGIRCCPVQLTGGDRGAVLVPLYAWNREGCRWIPAGESRGQMSTTTQLDTEHTHAVTLRVLDHDTGALLAGPQRYTVTNRADYDRLQLR